MKECFKCGKTKPLSGFYKHAQMGDGHLGKCKECTKRDVRDNRQKNIERIREYDRARGNRQTPKYRREYATRFPQKRKARRAVAYAIQSGKIKRGKCEVCGNDNVHAHHDDYLKMLEVRWLCPAHHRQWHTGNGEGLNGRLE